MFNNYNNEILIKDRGYCDSSKGNECNQENFCPITISEDGGDDGKQNNFKKLLVNKENLSRHPNSPLLLNQNQRIHETKNFLDQIPLFQKKEENTSGKVNKAWTKLSDPKYAKPLKWLQENYREHPTSYVLRTELYDRFTCKVQCDMNVGVLGKLLNHIFPNIRTRRIGSRGVSKYHYYGIESVISGVHTIIPEQRSIRPGVKKERLSTKRKRAQQRRVRIMLESEKPLSLLPKDCKQLKSPSPESPNVEMEPVKNKSSAGTFSSLKKNKINNSDEEEIADVVTTMINLSRDTLNRQNSSSQSFTILPNSLSATNLTWRLKASTSNELFDHQTTKDSLEAKNGQADDVLAILEQQTDDDQEKKVEKTDNQFSTGKLKWVNIGEKNIPHLSSIHYRPLTVQRFDANHVNSYARIVFPVIPNFVNFTKHLTNISYLFNFTTVEHFMFSLKYRKHCVHLLRLISLREFQLVEMAISMFWSSLDERMQECLYDPKIQHLIRVSDEYSIFVFLKVLFPRIEDYLPSNLTNSFLRFSESLKKVVQKTIVSKANSKKIPKTLSSTKQLTTDKFCTNLCQSTFANGLAQKLVITITHPSNIIKMANDLRTLDTNQLMQNNDLDSSQKKVFLSTFQLISNLIHAPLTIRQLTSSLDCIIDDLCSQSNNVDQCIKLMSLSLNIIIKELMRTSRPSLDGFKSIKLFIDAYALWKLTVNLPIAQIIQQIIESLSDINHGSCDVIKCTFESVDGDILLTPKKYYSNSGGVGEDV